MLTYIAILLTVLAVVGVTVVVRLGQVLRAMEQNAAETRELRLTSRARIRRASMQSGATSDEQVLRRLGRASAARRVVVGGDSDSGLYYELNRNTGEEDSNG